MVALPILGLCLPFKLLVELEADFEIVGIEMLDALGEMASVLEGFGLR